MQALYGIAEELRTAILQKDIETLLKNISLSVRMGLNLTSRPEFYSILRHRRSAALSSTQSAGWKNYANITERPIPTAHLC